MSTRSTLHPRLLHICLWLCLMLTGLGLTGCHSSDSTSPSASPGPVAPQVGMRPFISSDEKTVTELWISKNDAVAGDQWTARLTAKTPTDWRLASGPGDSPLVDRLADTEFVLHLLSTLQTLEITETGTSLTWDTAGLTSPKFVLRWTSPEGTRELVLGQSLSPTGSNYALLPKFAAGNPVVAVRGATLGMLEHLKSFDILRHRRLWTWSLDDVEQFEVNQGLRKTFSAHRQSGEWADEQNRIYQGPVQEWLERLIHLMVQKFDDDAADSASLYKKVQTTPAYCVTLKNRKGETRSISVGLENGNWWGLEDSRVGAVFRMDGDVAGYLLPPRMPPRVKRRVSSPKKHRSK